MNTFEEALEFLRLTRLEGPWCLTALQPDSGATDTIVAHDLAAARKWIAAGNGKRNVYFTANPLRWEAVRQKPAAVLLTAVEFVHIDIDCDKDVPEGADVLATIETRKAGALGRLQSFDRPGPPLAIVDTGGGLQAIWRLEKAINDIDAARQINRALVQALGGDPQCVSPIHLLRLPGTINLPNEKKRERGRVPVPSRLLRIDKERRRWAVESFERAEAPSSDQADYGIVPESVDDLAQLDLPARLRQMVEQGCIEGETLDGDNSRSGWAFYCAKLLGRYGVPAEIIAGILLDPGYGISAYVHERDDPKREAIRTTARALASLEAWERQERERALALFDSEPLDMESDAGGRTFNSVAGLSYRVASDIEIKALDWLWPGRFAKGKINSLSGEPGLSKTTLLLTVAAIVTRGGDWPDGSGRAEQGYVILLSAEDDAADTILPRFMAAGGDPNYLIVLEPVVQAGKDGARGFMVAEDIPRLEQLIRKIGPDRVKLIGLDPIGAMIGTSKFLNSFSDQDVRYSLGPLKQIAEKYMIAALFVGHFRKGSAEKVADRVLGSTAFTALARCNWGIIKETRGEKKEPTGRVLFVRLKQNIGVPADALVYTIVNARLSGGIEAPRIEWQGQISGDADDIVRGMAGRRVSKVDAAVAFVEELLGDGEMPASEAIRQCAKAGISERSARRATRILGVGKYRKGGRWYWWLPGSITETPTPD